MGPLPYQNRAWPAAFFHVLKVRQKSNRIPLGDNPFTLLASETSALQSSPLTSSFARSWEPSASVTRERPSVSASRAARALSSRRRVNCGCSADVSRGAGKHPTAPGASSYPPPLACSLFLSARGLSWLKSKKKKLKIFVSSPAGSSWIPSGGLCSMRKRRSGEANT